MTIQIPSSWKASAVAAIFVACLAVQLWREATRRVDSLTWPFTVGFASEQALTLIAAALIAKSILNSLIQRWKPGNTAAKTKATRTMVDVLTVVSHSRVVRTIAPLLLVAMMLPMSAFWYAAPAEPSMWLTLGLACAGIPGGVAYGYVVATGAKAIAMGRARRGLLGAGLIVSLVVALIGVAESVLTFFVKDLFVLQGWEPLVAWALWALAIWWALRDFNGPGARSLEVA